VVELERFTAIRLPCEESLQRVNRTLFKFSVVEPIRQDFFNRIGQMKAFAELHASTKQDRAPLLVARQNNKAQRQTGLQDERGTLIKYSLKG
jgi:hypothetical protein